MKRDSDLLVMLAVAAGVYFLARTVRANQPPAAPAAPAGGMPRSSLPQGGASAQPPLEPDFGVTDPGSWDDSGGGW